MKTPKKGEFVALKTTLFIMASLFAIAVVILINLATRAAIPDGLSPASAIALTKDVNKDKLNPGQQQWYKFTPAPGKETVEIEKSLTLIFTPDDGYTINFVGFNIFEESQTTYYFEGDTSKMANLGAGQIVSRDGNPETGELIWNGWISGPKTYYIQVFNKSNLAIDYWLFKDDVSNYELGEPHITTDNTEAAITKQPGITPNNPEPLTADITHNSLAPNTTRWYNFAYTDPTGQNKFKQLAFTMFTTPNDGQRRHQINFELYPLNEIIKWQRGDIEQLPNFGAGSLVSRDGDEQTIEHIWNGFIPMGETYLLAVHNNSDTEVDYWLYNQDIYNPELGPTPEAEPKPDFAPGAAPQKATPLKIGLNKGGLEPGQEIWYSFVHTDFNQETFEKMALTMITTPNDGNRIQNMVFDIFTEEGTWAWSPGDNSRIKNIGAGSVVQYDGNPVTGERFWQGWVLDNKTYFVQIRNGTDIHMDYWLYTGDIRNPKLGQDTKPTAQPRVAPGTTVGSAIPLNDKTSKGQLQPNSERWYTFSRDEENSDNNIEANFTMIFTPDDGRRSHHINLELYEKQALTGGEANAFGQGTVVSRDGNPLTGELIWKGYIFTHNQYYMRIRNESDVVIDYYIYPEDVIHTSLGE